MPLTPYPHGIRATPVIGATGYGWSSQSTPYFVDGTNGSDGGNNGKDPARAFATINKAISTADAWDVIYILPKAWVSGNLWLGTTYQDTTDLSIPYAKQGMAVVGVAHQGLIGAAYSVVITEVSASTAPLLRCHAPMCAFEGLTFYNASTAVNGLHIYGDVAGTSEAMLNSVYNCHFHGCLPSGATGDTGGAVFNDATWGCTVDSCTFMGCRIGVSSRSGTGTCGKVSVKNNTFWSRLTAASDISADVYIYTQGSTCVEVFNNRFAHLIPSYTGGHSRWVSIQADVRQGIVAHNYCGGVGGTNYTEGATGSGIVCPANVGHGPNWSNAALMATAT